MLCTKLVEYFLIRVTISACFGTWSTVWREAPFMESTVIMNACCLLCVFVCMYVITFSNRNIFHGFTLVTTFCSKMCHMENKGCSLVSYFNGKIKERGQCLCVCVCVCVNGLKKRKNGD